MSIARDRADRKGTTPIQIGNTKLTTDSSDNLSIGNASGTPKKLIASELEIGDSSNKVIIKKGSDNKVQFQTQASGGSATDSNAGGGVTVYANTAALQAASGTSEGDLGFVTATKKLMLRTSTGWYFVATVTNATPVISSAGDSSYAFATDGTPIVIDVAATDTDGETLTYAYQVTAGSLGSTATVVQGSGANVNRFTVTPSTNSAHSGSFTLKFSATDPNSNIALSSGSTFTLSFGTSGSLYFDGSGDFIHHAASSDFTMGTGNFTLEFWVDWADDDLSSNEYMISLGGNALRVSNNGGVINCFGSGSDKLTFTPTTAEKTGWHHIALVRNGTTNTVYYDGQSKVSATNSSWNHTSNTLVVGQYDNGSTNGGYTWGPGYLSNIRIVKGTAVYTSNFTPSTAPLTAVSGTVYLIASNFVPLATTNGAYHFTSNTSKLRVDSSDFNLASNTAFTIEMWYKLISAPDSRALWDFGNGNAFQFYKISGQFKIYGFGGGYVIDFGSGVGTTLNKWYHVAITGDGSNNVKAYLDGVQVGSTYNASWTLSGSKILLNGNLAVSQPDNKGVEAYFSDFRVVNGTQVYTGAFTPPSGPLTTTGGTYPSNTNVNTSITASHTKLLTCQNSSGSHVDNSPSGHTFVAHGTVTPRAGVIDDTTDISTSSHALNFAGDTAYSYATPFVNGLGGSVKLNSSNYMTFPANSDFNFGTNNFTIEAWVWPDSTASDKRGGWVEWGPNDTSNTLRIFQGTSGQSNSDSDYDLEVLYKVGGTNKFVLSVDNGLTPDTWNHITLQRISNTVSFYVDGVLKGSASYSGTVDVSSWVGHIGIDVYGTDRIATGYISNVRIVKGTAIYTPTTTAGGIDFATAGETTLASNSAFDFGTNNFTIEFFYKWSTNSGYQTLFDHEQYSAAGCTLQSNTNTYKWALLGSGMSVTYETSNATQDVWHHYAIVRNGNNVRIYRDGVITREFTHTGTIGSVNPSSFGDADGQSYPDKGKLSNFRIIKGTALYTSAGFTIPSSNLTAVSGTSLLLFQENSGSTLDDGSTNNVTVTKHSNHNILTNDGPFHGWITKPTSSLTAVTNTKLLTCNDSNVINDASSSNHTITLQNYPIPTKFIPFS